MLQLAESEYHVMNEIWNQDGIPARELAQNLSALIGWSKTTTYTVISRCLEKSYIRREDPGFHCYALVSRQQVAEWDTDTLINRGYAGCPDLLIASLLGRKKLSGEQLQRLKKLVEEIP